MPANEWTGEFGPFDEDERADPVRRDPGHGGAPRERPYHGNFRIGGAHGQHHDIAASAIPIVGRGGSSGAIVIFWPVTDAQEEEQTMKLKVWGARGSIPAPGPETMRYGGNTSCVELTLDDGSTLILDAGTGIRNLGLALPRDRASRSTSCSPTCTSTTSRG